MKKGQYQGISPFFYFTVTILFSLFLFPEISFSCNEKIIFDKQDFPAVGSFFCHHFEKDTLEKKLTHSPKKAALLSAIIPGAGQFYNKKYWKIGIIAAGSAALIYSTQFNNQFYHDYKDELIIREQKTGTGNPNYEQYTNANLSELQGYYKRNRDLSVIGLALLYAANIIDATVDAHLFDFNFSDDLSLKIRPETSLFANGHFNSGITLLIKF